MSLINTQCYLALRLCTVAAEWHHSRDDGANVVKKKKNNCKEETKRGNETGETKARKKKFRIWRGDISMCGQR